MNIPETSSPIRSRLIICNETEMRMKDAILLLVSVAVQNKFELLCLHKSERGHSHRCQLAFDFRVAEAIYESLIKHEIEPAPKVAMRKAWFTKSGGVLEPNCAKCAQWIVLKSADGIDWSSDDTTSQIVDSMASEIFNSLVLNVVKPESAEMGWKIMLKDHLNSTGKKWFEKNCGC